MLKITISEMNHKKETGKGYKSATTTSLEEDKGPSLGAINLGLSHRYIGKFIC